MLQISFSPKSVFERVREKYASKLTPDELNRVRDVIKDNFTEIWASEGSSIGGDWKGRDLVDTGALKQEMTSGRGIKINPQSITITSSRPYASFVNKRYRFMALSSKALRQLAQIYTRKSIIQR
jgi:hypothetical protein